MNKHSINFRGLKATPQLLICFSVFFCFYAQVAVLRAQEWSEEDVFGSAIGIRLPEVQSLDPRVFPFEQTPNRGLSLRGEVFPSMDWRPLSLKRRVEIDSTGKFFVVSEELNGLPLRPAYVVPVKNIVSQRLAYEQALAWHKAAAENIYRTGEDERRGPGGVSIDIPVPIKSRAFEQIFGGNTVGLNVQGDISIKMGGRQEKRKEVQTALTRGSNFSFKMQQTQRFTVTGRIGEKVTVNVDQDSERAFDFENNIKLNYTGFDDDIVQKIEAGNVALSLPGTRFVTFGGTSAGLFGIKSEMQFGNLAVTAIASQEKGENKKLTLSGGTTEGKKQIQGYEYYDNAYFFLDQSYRELYRQYSEKWIHQSKTELIISRIQVYRSRSGDDINPKSIPGTAYRDPRPGSLDRAEIYRGSFIRLDADIDYEVVTTLGYIIMKTRMNDDEVLAVAYENGNGKVGDIDYNSTQRDSISLKLIKPRSPVPSRDPLSTWQLMWKNIYYLGSRDNQEDDFQPKIFFKPPSGLPEETLADSGRTSYYLNVFGLDITNTAGTSLPDNLVDNNPAILKIVPERGSAREHIFLIFPDLRPFDPEGVYVNGVLQKVDLPPDKRVAAIYDTSATSVIYDQNKFFIEIKSQNRSSTYSLGFNVIENSEEVLLDGRKLSRDQDYNIDYFSGNLVILNEEALKPGHTLEISYQGNQLFQLEKKTIIGTRAEYRLNPNSFVGGTLMYLNETTLDQRVRLGSVDKGPMRNLIWDFNTALRFQPNFLTSGLNALPFISTQEPSDLRLEAEIAQIIPNPNTIDSKIPKANREKLGDKNGVAYIDDFEATKRVTPLGVNRRGWVEAAIPEQILRDPRNPPLPASDQKSSELERRALSRRGKLIWFNPFRGVLTQEIYPNRQVDAGNATTQVLSLVFTPTDSLGRYNLNATDSWGGITRALSSGFYKQEESKFIEIWFYGTKGRMHIDLGQISEDVIPNGRLNTEDTNDGVRNGILQEGEDKGLDGVIGKDPADYWDVNRNGNRDWGEPASYDDWFYPSGSDQYDTPGSGTINGTETSKNDANEGGGSIRPDTEDINGNGNVDFTNNYFSYSFPLAPDSAAAQRYLQGGNIKGWKLYRIPLAEVNTVVGTPSLSRIEYVRIWLDGFADAAKPDTIIIADISLAGNEWKEIGIGKYEGTVAKYMPDERLEVTVVNTDENPSYRPPDGVEGEIDQIRRLQTKEQSQVLRVKGKGLGKDSIAVVQKTFFQPLNLINYNRIKMFVNGNNVMLGDSVEFFIRFGADTSNYYEFREQVFQGWHAQNVMNLNLLALATLRLDITDTTQYDTAKFRRIISGPIRDYFGLRFDADPALRQDIGVKATQEVRIRGNPSLTNIRILMAGIKNVGKPEAYFAGEIWMDELRVVEVKKDKGIAMRARFDLKLADFITLGGEVNQRDADFHNVAERFGGGNNQQSYTLGGNVTLDKILPQSLGLSVPVSMNYSYSTATPKYVPGTDIQAINNPRIESIEVDTDGDGKIDQKFRNVIRSVSKQSSVNFSIKRRSRSQNFFIKNTIDNLAASLNYTSSDARGSQTALARRTAWSGDASYNLTFGSKNFIQPFKWIGEAPLLSKLTDTKLYYTPQNFGAQLQATTSTDKSQNQILDPRTYKITKGIRNDVSSYAATYNYRTSMKLFENLSSDFSRAFTNDLRAANKNQRHFLLGLLTDDKEMLSMTQSFGVRYTPNLFNWFNPNFSYTSNYRYTNNIQQRSIGRSAGTSTNLTANGTWRFAEMFKFLKRKDSPSGRETPGRTRQAPRIPPGEQQPPNEEGDEAERPDQAQPEQRPERQPPGQPQEKKDEEEKQEKEDKPGRGISPLELLRFFSKFKDIGVNFTRTESFSHIALDSTDMPRFIYMLGFVPRPGVDTVGGFITTPRQYQRGINYSLSSGLDISRNFSLTLRFEHDQRRNEGTTTTGSVSDTWLRTKELGLPLLPDVEIPFPEWTLTVSGLERINVFSKFASSLSISHGVGGKQTKTWSGNPNNITNEDFSLNFRPLLKINLSWKNGMVSSFQYNKTTGDRPTYALPNPNNPLQDYHDREQGAQITRNTDISFTTTYSKQSGFRVPLPFLKNKELRNSVDLSINLLYNVNETAQRSGGNDKEFGGEKTTRWSLSPRMTYSFSNRVRGGAHFEIGKTKSLRSGDTQIFELGIDVNISIRGE